MSKKDGRTAAFLERAIHKSGKTQTQIAREAGLKQPNVLSMMKLGQTKIPISRIPALAKACGVDELAFVKIALREYHPEIFEVLSETIGESLTRSEWDVIRCYRARCRGEDLEIDTEVKLRLMNLFDEIRDRQAKGKWPPRKR